MEKPLLFVVTLVMLALVGAGFVCVRKQVRDGYEDDKGFHYGDQPPHS